MPTELEAPAAPSSPWLQQEGLKAGAQRSRKKHREAPPALSGRQGSPFVLLKPERGSQPASLSPYGPTQVSGRPERPGRRYWFCGILQSDLLPQFPYYSILPESSKSTPLHSIQAL